MVNAIKPSAVCVTIPKVSTYQAYISKTQPAGTYTGQVKYTLVHPHDTAAPQIPPKTIATATYLQDVEACPADLTTNQIYTLKDSRDEHEYKVAKLVDGKCWLLENLALDPTDSTTAANMNERNTNASTAAITNYLNGGSSTTTGWSNTAVADVDTGFNSFTAPMINNASKDTLVTGYGAASTNGQAKVGIYYNYCAATVGTYCYDENNGVDIPNTFIDAPMDVCPAGWRMPTAAPSYPNDPNVSDYFALAYALELGYYDEDGVFTGNANAYAGALALSMSGQYQNSASDDQNSSSGLWSSTSFDNGIYSPYMSYESWLTIYPTSYGNRNIGESVRCLLAGQ
jgi:uncharacterized protein (TIGR02145 family)